MKLDTLFTLTLMTAFAGCASATEKNLTPNTESTIDWPAFMQDQDMIWKSIPLDWTEGPFLGNGWLGTMIYQNGKAKNQLRIDVQHTGVYDNEPFGGAVNTIDKVSAKNKKSWIDQHCDWWHSYYKQSFVSIPDSKLQSFYWIQMFKMGGATRADRGLIDNHGPWLENTKWPYATWNLNVQLSYWPYYGSNHLDGALSLPNHITKYSQNLINTIGAEYRHDSAAVSRATNETLIGKMDYDINLTRPDQFETGNLPWAMHDVWLHYRHSMDGKFLKTHVYPMLKRSINLYFHLLYKGDDGKYHLPTTYSPEYGSAPDCNYDLALLRWGCSTLLWANDRLNLNDPLASKWQDLLDNLTDYPGDDTKGFYIGAKTPFAKGHRHFSHLLMIYPLYLVNTDQPDGREIIERCIADWHSMPKSLRGYSFTGSSSMYAAIGDGNRSLDNLMGLFDKFLKKNTMYAESGPVIETPLAAAQSILDMLIQSWGNKIRIFPAVPDKWKDATFENLRTEGAFLVSASRKGGKTKWVKVKSLAGEPFMIDPGIEEPIIKGAKQNTQKIAGNLYQLNLKKGQQIIFTIKDTTRLTVEPVKTKEIYRFGRP